MNYFALGLVAIFAAVSFASETPVDWSIVKPIDEFRPLPISASQEEPLQQDSRIVGGQEAIPHSLPYQVALLVEVSEGTAFCGGSLLSTEWVLTAAHCVDTAREVKLILGAHNVKEEEPSQVRLSATHIIIHPQWNPSKVQNDVALIRLPHAVKLNQNIQTIRLPSRSQLNDNLVDVDALASGWGKPSDGSTGISPVLRYVYTPVINNLRCSIRYLGVIQNSHICTSGFGGKSTCNGDSGGPLVVQESDGHPTQVGIVSFGIALGCGLGWPAAFSRVTSYAQWISDNTCIPLRN